MKAQSLYLVAYALAGVFCAPVAMPDPNVKTVTVYETVVHVVTATHTVWIPASTGTPGGAHVEDCDIEPTPGSQPDMYNKQPSPPKPHNHNNVNSNSKPAPEKPQYAQLSPAQYNPSTESEPETKPKIVSPPQPAVNYASEPKPYVPPTPPTPPTQPSPSPSPESKPYVPPTQPQTYAPKPVVKVEAVSQPTASTTGSTAIQGDATFYAPGMGSCGIMSTADQDIVAIPHGLMEAKNTGNPNNNPLCGKRIIATRGTKSVTCTVVDTCPGCDNTTLDLSPAAFNVLGAPAEGRIPITWSWVGGY